MTLRLRLTLWYALALAAGLSLFAATIWFSMRASLSAALNANMEDRAHSVALFFAHEMDGGRPPDLLDELGEFSQGLPGGIAIEILDSHGVPVFSSTPPIRGGQIELTRSVQVAAGTFEIRVIGSLEPSRQTLGRLRILLFAFTPLVILIAAVGAYWLSRRALKPLAAIIDAAQNVSIENLSQRLTVPQTGDELQRLSETWNSVLARLEAAVNRLSQFTADASHELRTPLAVIRATAEIAARKSRSPEVYRAALHEVVAEADRMTQLVEDLLFVARCDAAEIPLAPLDLGDVTAEVCAAVAPLAEAKGIELETDLQSTFCEGNAAALRRLTLALLDNAIKYTEPAGRIRVALSESRLIIEDTGIGIPPSDLPRIFERFYRGDPSRSGQGYGLGLSQAKIIAERHGASIRCTSKRNEGSVFEVIFPATAAPRHETVFTP